MKKSFILLITTCFLALTACKQEVPEKPKVTYDNASKSKADVKVDTTQIEVADLPIHIPGTNFLIHPVGDLTVSGGTKVKYDSASNAGNVSFNISNYGEGEITGYLRNLKFQKIGQDSLKVLSDKPLLIQTATYLKLIAEKSKVQIMAYTLADVDTNNDGKLDASDIKSLYLSEMGGARFMKLSADMQELIDWSVIETQNRLYFRTIEDTNKNGEFDKNDVVHYHFVDLLSADWKVSDYKPV